MDRIYRFGSLRYSFERIAMLVVADGVDMDAFRRDFHDSGSGVYKKYHAGLAATDYEIEKMLLEQAEALPVRRQLPL